MNNLQKEFPSIFHIGLPKTGTTTLQYILNKDNRLNVTRDRYFNEVDWWTKDYLFIKKGLINILSEENQILQSDEFVKLSLTLSRISRVQPNAIIIVTIREQRQLLESRYRFEIPYCTGYHRSFEKWLKSNCGLDHISATMYYTMYKTINAFFPKKQIKFLLFEDLANNYQNFFKELYHIIGIPMPIHFEMDVKKNKSLSDAELLIIRNLNKFKLFTKESKMAHFEANIYRKMASKLKNTALRTDEFKWANSDFFKKMEEDFKYENNCLTTEKIVDPLLLKKYNYLI